MVKRVRSNEFFTRNGWPLAVISVIAVLRGLLYLPVGTAKLAPQGLEVVIGSSPILFGGYCLLWIAAGLIGIGSAFRKDRRLAVTLLTILCAAWAVGYLIQFSHDLFSGGVKAPEVYFGGLTYLGFGAAVFRYPAKG